MERFKTLESVVAVIDLINIDTDMIIPKQFLKTVKKSGLKKGLFYEMRYDIDGNENHEFILNQKSHESCKIIIGGENFGCGSSREHAPWAIVDFGIRVIIAPSFGDIFYNNSFKNGLLPIKVPKKEVDNLKKNSYENKVMRVNLEDQIIEVNGVSVNFKIEKTRKEGLLNGLDDIGLTLKKNDKIEKFESEYKKLVPWLHSY